jgi:Cu+-exporting ATPase
MERADISIRGMSCAACVGRIEGVLRRRDGVGDASVNLMTQRGTVHFDPALLTPAAIASLVTESGFPSAVLKATDDAAVELLLRIESVGSSQPPLGPGPRSPPPPPRPLRDRQDGERLQRVLLSQKGVTAASVDCSQQCARLSVDRDLLRVHELTAAVQDELGGGAQPVFELAEADRGANALANESRDKEAAEWRSRFRSSLAFTVPVFTIMKIMPMFAATRGIVDYEVHKGLPLGPLLCLFLTTPVQFGIGRVFYRGAYAAMQHGSANMDVLVVLGTSTAYFYSLAVLLDQLVNPQDPGHVCFEASAMLITFLSLGREPGFSLLESVHID